MLLDLLNLLPAELSSFAVGLAIAGAVLGLGLWAAGARFTQAIMVLGAVTIGALAGREAPGWFDLSISNWTTAIGIALVLGISGYAFHKTWVALCLALLLACWTALGTWLLCADHASWSWPNPEGQTPPQYVASVWQSLPEGVRSILPYAAGVAALAGIALGAVLPRLAAALLFSMLGISLVLGMGSAAVRHYRPEWLGILPADTHGQLVGLGIALVLGMLLQWWVAWRPARSAVRKAPRNEEGN
jgi:hypothetical protein